MERARTEGRVVTVEQIIRSDAGAAESVRRLAEIFKTAEQVGFWCVDNAAAATRLAGIGVAAPQDYTEVRKELYAILDEARKSGQITEAEYDRVNRR